MRGAGYLFAAIAAGICWLGGQNVFAEDPATLETAEDVACRRTVCTTELVWRNRTPWSQRMQFRVNESITREVLCSRPLWVVGDSQCQLVNVDDR